MKKYLCMVLTAAMLLSLCACSRQATDSENPAAAVESESTTEITAPAQAESTEESETPAEAETSEAEEAESAWSREGYFEDADGRFLSITWMEKDNQEFGWYVGYMFGDLMYGNFISEQDGKLTGNIVPDYEEGEYIVTVSEEGEDGVLLETEDGAYPLAAQEIEKAPITAMINTDGYGYFNAVSDAEDAFETDEDFSSQSFIVNLYEPAAYTLTAKGGDDDWEFVKWTKDGEDFSTDPEITVEFSEEMVEYIAVFNYTAAEAAAVLDEDTNPVFVKVDLNGGWDVRFASGALYLYDAALPQDEAEAEAMEAVAIGVTLEEDVFNEYKAEAEKSGSMRELENGFAYTAGDGTEDYFITVGDGAYFMIDTEPGTDGEEIFGRLYLEQGRGEFTE